MKPANRVNKMAITLWHNPSCGSSRNALDYLREKGIEPDIYLYLKERPGVAIIAKALKQLGLGPADLLRPKEAIGEEIGIYDEGDPQKILAAMAAHSVLIQRPLVFSAKGALIARPRTRIDDIL